MPLYLTDDQAMLRDTARDFMREQGGIAKELRRLRDAGCSDGFGHALWKQFGEMGFTGILIDEADGGMGLGHVEAGIVLEEIGRNLTPSPFLTTAVAATRAIEGTAHADRWFPKILAGEAVAEPCRSRVTAGGSGNVQRHALQVHEHQLGSGHRCECMECLQVAPAAIAHFDRLTALLKRDPEFSNRDAVYYYLGESLMRVERDAEALPYYERLITGAGYAKVKDLLAHHIRGTAPPEILVKRAARARADGV